MILVVPMVAVERIDHQPAKHQRIDGRKAIGNDQNKNRPAAQTLSGGEPATVKIFPPKT